LSDGRIRIGLKESKNRMRIFLNELTRIFTRTNLDFREYVYSNALRLRELQGLAPVEYLYSAGPIGLWTG
jgi:hypothetical protein